MVNLRLSGAHGGAAAHRFAFACELMYASVARVAVGTLVNQGECWREGHIDEPSDAVAAISRRWASALRRPVRS